jgi:hypothetical protein
MPANGDEAFEREKTSYEQNFEHVRVLIPMTYQIPAMAITITGGLWFGVLKTNGVPAFGYLFLILAFMMNVGFYFIMRRFGQIIDIYLDALKEFCPKGYVKAKGNPNVSQHPEVITVFKLFCIGAAAFSVVGILLLWLNGPLPPS